MIDFIMNHALIITAIFAALYVLVAIGEHYARKRKESEGKSHARNRASDSHSR